MKLEINNSYCQFTGEVPTEVRELVKQILTYRNDIDAEKGNLFYRIRRAKQNDKQYFKLLEQLKKLEASEWVCWYSDDHVFPTGVLNIVREALRVLGTRYEEVDHRQVPTPDLILNWRNKPFDMRYYQDDMFKLGVQHGRGVFESAVGTGKSLLMAYLVHHFSAVSLIVVPSSGLSLQLYKDFASWFGANKVGIIDTKVVRSGRKLPPIRIITVQALASLQKSGDLKKLVGDVNALFVDEIHHAGSASYTNLLNEIQHVYYRFGFTGTFLRNDSKSLDMWGFLSNVLYRYPAHKAIEDGFLTPIEVTVHTLPGKRKMNYKKEYDLNYCGNPHLLEKLRETIFNAALGKQVLILVSLKDKSGAIITEYLRQHGLNVAYISGDNSKEEISATIHGFNEKEFPIMVGSGVIGEGIDVRSTDHLFMCQGGKSEIVMVQATGRLVRLFDGKFIGHYHDFNFTGTKYMQKHLKQRVDAIKRNFEPRAIHCP